MIFVPGISKTRKFWLQFLAWRKIKKNENEEEENGGGGGGKDSCKYLEFFCVLKEDLYIWLCRLDERGPPPEHLLRRRRRTKDRYEEMEKKKCRKRRREGGRAYEKTKKTPSLTDWLTSIWFQQIPKNALTLTVFSTNSPNALQSIFNKIPFRIHTCLLFMRVRLLRNLPETSSPMGAPFTCVISKNLLHWMSL